MSDGRWRIWCEPVKGVEWCRLFGLEPHEVLKNIWVARGPDGFEEVFASLPEARTHAMRSSRTVEVELPDIEVRHITTSYGTTIDRAEQIPLSTPAPGQWGQRLEAEHGKKGPTIRLEGPYGSIYWCSWDDVKTTALHLLALYYAKERSLNEP